jgi:hypothetical protein
MGLTLCCKGVYTINISNTPTERIGTMYTNTLKMAELQEAVDFYASVDFDPNQARPLMELLQAQTDYIQKRFWKMADEAKAK